MIRSRLLAACATAVLPGLLLTLPAPSLAHEGAGDSATNTRAEKVATRGEGENMKFVANLQYDRSGEAQQGSDIEFYRLGRKKYALAGTLGKGLQIIDITRPRHPERVAVYDCKISQGDIQVIETRHRVLATYTADGTFGEEGAASTCGRDLELGPDAAGTVLVDITHPRNPRTVSFVPVERGSHNMTVHPSGKYLYNSNSDLITSTEPTITIYDISNPRRPELVQHFPIPFVPASLGSESHDITFNRSGKRAYAAALSQTLVLNTKDPRNPRIIGQIVDPAINVVHQSDPVTLRREDGSRREVLVITDERAGAAASAECPGGGLHLYDITGRKERNPEKIGTWFIPAATVQDGATCTSHVLRIYPRQELMTIAWYAQGVRVISLEGLADFEGSPAAVGIGDGVGLTEVGHFVMPDSDAWSFKTNKIRRDGSFFGYANDLVRGFDVFKFKGLDHKVPPLRPENVRPKREDTGSRVAAPLALVAPAVVIAGLLRLRQRRRGQSQKVCSSAGKVPLRTSSA